MSEMQRNRGIIKRLSTKKTAKVVFDQLVSEGKIEPKWCEFDDDGTPNYIESENYILLRGEIFDVSDAPDESDDNAGEVNEAVKLNDNEYRIHAYYYNGGANLSEMLYSSIPTADKEYENPKKKIYYAIKLNNGRYVSRDNSIAPALYASANKAKETLLRHFPGWADNGYEIVRFGEL